MTMINVAFQTEVLLGLAQNDISFQRVGPDMQSWIFTVSK